MPKTLTVIGATGIQGSSVIDAALRSPGEWQIRALTRDPESKAGQALSKRGIQVVKADLNDARSLPAAFKGSYAIFATTDFFGPFAAFGADAQKAMDIEWTQTKNIMDAALACGSLQHFIWSTLPHANRLSNGKYSVPHFEAKNRGEDYIRSHPSLLAKTTFALVGWYASNFHYPLFKPTFIDTADTHIQMAPVPADVPISTIGDPKANIGKFIMAILNQPEETLPGRYVHVAIEETSMGKLLEDWSVAVGRSALYVQTTMEAYDALWPGWGNVEGVMFLCYKEIRGKPWLTGLDDALITARQLGLRVEEMVGVKDAIRGF